MITIKQIFIQIAFLLLRATVFGQIHNEDSAITLRQAVEISRTRYPIIKSHQSELQAAAANVQLVKYIKIPTLDVSYQANLSTANNITGLFYPGEVLPMTGPPSRSNNFSPATGSAASLLLNWQAITFGAQDAKINVAKAEANVKKQILEREIFQNNISVISKYLDVLLAQENVRIQDQNIQRINIALRESKVLSTSGIRPGVDTALFLSELSKAKVEWVQSRRQLETEQWLLAELLVMDHLPITIDTVLLMKLPAISSGDTSFSTHPLVQYAQSEILLSKAKEQMFRSSWRPQLNVFGTLFGRGSGFGVDGDLKIANGLAFNRYNYAAGFQLAFPILKYGEVKRQLQVQYFLTRSTQENLDQTNRELITQQRIANSAFNNSIAVVQETQLQLKSAQYAYNAMHVRYNTGLVNLTDVVQVEYNLLQAELSLKKSYWDTWKALLLEAAVKGDIQIFLIQIP